MTVSGPDEPNGERCRRACAGFDTVARSAGDVRGAARLHCIAAVESLGFPTEEALPRRPVGAFDAETLIRGALHELGSLPFEDFATCRTAAAHGRRALRELR